MTNSPDAPTGDDATFIQTIGVKKSYRIGGRTIEVLRGIDLAVAKGEFLAVRGVSGAGKSTLLHLLGGLDLPDSGDVLYARQKLRSFGGSRLAGWRNASVGLIFQSYHLLPELSAIENVILPAMIGRGERGVSRDKAGQLLDRVGLGARLDHRPPELSGGEQQRVAIARSLINSPALILADEPTGNLDSRTGEEIMDLLRTLRAEAGATLIIATHDNNVARHAGRSIEIRDGAIEPSPAS
jgi:ABC-type lipoprotein export system ATPase subunit